MFGQFSDELHISLQATDTVMKIILAYLFIGSYAILFWLWRQKRKIDLTDSSSEKTTGSSL